MREIALHVHSFSLRYHFRHPGQVAGSYDVFRYIEDMAGEGFTGVNISANGPGYRDLGGTDAAHFHAVDAHRRAFGLALELDTSDTAPDNMRRMLDVTAACGGDTLRTYTRHKGPVADKMRAATADLSAVAERAASLGITIVLENHEDFQGPQLAAILAAVGHPSVRALYDYGNSQMVGEEPVAALDAMAPFIARCHIKDHVIVTDGAGAAVVQGVAMGDGTLPIRDLTDRLYDNGLRRFCFENVWSYVAPVTVDPALLPATPCFARFGPEHHLVGDALPPAEAVEGEHAAFVRGLDWFRAMLAEAGYRIAAIA